jgi:hypothetical protein
LAGKAAVVVTASQDELRRHLVFVARVVLYPLSLNIGHLNYNSLTKELETVVVLVFFEVDASKVVHARSQLLLVVELVKNLSDLMIVEESLVIISFVEGVSCHLDRLCQVTERKV